MKVNAWEKNSVSLLKKHELDFEKIRKIVSANIIVPIPTPALVTTPKSTILVTRKSTRVIKKRENKEPRFRRRRSNASVCSVARSDWTPEEITYFRSIGIYKY
jgi:hypothetical protein